MVRNGRIPVRFFAEPDLMTSCCLPMKIEAEGLKAFDDVAVSEGTKPSYQTPTTKG
jgi:hypothetical protein